MTIYTHPEYVGLFASACEALHEPWRQGVVKDWLLDHGVSEATAGEAVLRRPLSVLDVWSFDDSSGNGSGIGIGNGSGRGSGSGIGIGIGSGSGRGSGIGSGRGSGLGSGIGSGSGSGSGIGSQYKVRQMKIGQAYLIHCGDWHTFCGRVVEQTGPSTYELEAVSKISETNNGDCWHALAAGDERLRKAATYQHYKVHAVIPLMIAAFEWQGKLPQEEEQA